jgi:xanthine dehydrogenase iron-sulfur cluster and FAD-binding subunit A
MSASALLASNSHPTDSEIDAAMSGNICRCGTYLRIREAIKHATQSTGQGGCLPFANGKAEAARADSFTPNAVIRIGADGKIALTMPYVEMGQGTYTSIPMPIAEELEVDRDACAIARVRRSCEERG